MDSLNSYGSGGESDSSANVSVSKKSSVDIEEADANCEPITMDMSEESGGDDMEPNDRNLRRERRNFTSKSESPTSSYSSRSSSLSNKKSHRQENDTEFSAHSSNDRLGRKSSKEKRRDENKDREDEKHDRHNRDEKDKRSSHHTRRDERKRHHSRSRSPEYVKRKSSRYKHRSRSRSHSRDRYRHKRSKEHGRGRSSRDRSRDDSRGRSRDSSRGRSKDSSRGYSRDRSREHSSEHGLRRHYSPYRSRKSRSKSPRDKPKSYDWKTTSKLKVLEKLGIPFNIPTTNVTLPQPNIVSTATAATASFPMVSNNGAPLTPQLLLQKTMEEQVEKVKTATGIQLPSYYNPIAVNPSKYAEQMQKRKLLWGNKDKQTQQTTSCGSNMEHNAPTNPENKGTGTIWQGAKFGGDQDGRMTAKFQRLMGIKSQTTISDEEIEVKKTKESPDLIKKQEEMFNSMESQYEVARLATHSHRGLGLGFGTFQPR